jgi:hypothetical protein
MLSTPEHSVHNSDQQTHFYYLSRELRRAACWGIGGALLLAPIQWYVFAHIQQRGIADQIIGVLFFVLVALSLLQCLLPRIRVDKTGVSRRSLWTWDLWSWDEFASGTLRGGFSANQFVSAARPMWRRKLSLGVLEPADAVAIGDLIRRVWVLPDVGPVPETLTIQMRWPGRPRLHLSRSGIKIEKAGVRQSYGWQELKSITIWRAETGRQDFREMELILPDQKFKLLRRESDSGGEWNNWTSCSSELASAAICRFADPSSLYDFALQGPARTLEELAARHFRQLRARSEAVTGTKWCSRLMWGLAAIMPLLFPWPNSIGMVLMTTLLAAAVHWLYKDTKRELEELHRTFNVERAAFVEPRQIHSGE